MVSLGTDPNAYFGRFLDKQRRDDQFSEDMKKVMYGGPTQAGAGGRTAAGNAAGRTRSPGLAAGAALALGGQPSSAAEAHLEARTQCRQAVENSRRQVCPFDDHSAFGACPSDRARAAPVGAPPLEQDEVFAAVKDARNTGKYNRDIQQKIGAGAPFDAPETTFGGSAGSSIPTRSSSGRRCGVPPAMPQPSLAESTIGSRAEAETNKCRMRGCQDLLGGYLPDKVQTRRNNSLPPRPADPLLPQSMFKLQFDGGSVGALTSERAAYLNSRVSCEANRERNRAGVVLG